MSRAHALHKARARQLYAQKEKNRIRKNHDIHIGRIVAQLRWAGTKGAYITVAVPIVKKNQKIPNTRRIKIPPASARPALERALKVAHAEKKVTLAKNKVHGLSLMPISLQVGSQRPLASGANRRARTQWTQTQAHDVRMLTKKHDANVNLWNAEKELANAQGSKFTKGKPKAPFAIQGSGEKLATLSSQSGFDVGLQLKKTNERFGLDLSVNDVTADAFSGGLVGEASSLFGRNRKIDKLKTEIEITKPNTVALDEFSGYDTLFERRDSIVNQQKSHLDQINKIQDPDLRIAKIENDLPQFNERAGQIDGLITGLDTRIKTTRATRKPQELLSATGSLKSFNIRDLISRRNALAKIRNEKAKSFESIKDPALRQVTLEQDIPQFDKRIGVLDSDITKSVKFAESRKLLDIGIVNAPVKRRGRRSKTFDVTIGDNTQTFKRNTRGAKKAQLFFQKQKAKKQKEIAKIQDPVLRAVAVDQDIGIINLGIKAQKVQGKVLKAERRADLEALNIGGAFGSAGFMPFTPSDTPTGRLNVPAIPKRRGTPKVFEQLNYRRFSGRGRANSNELDIGNIFGSSAKIKTKQSGQFDFF